MELSFTWFLYAIFLVSLFVAYAVLYIIAYKILHLDKKINDRHLALILFFIAVWISPLLFSPLFDVASYFILCWYAN